MTPCFQSLPGRLLLNWWRICAMKPITDAEEECQTLINGGDLLRRQFSVHAPDPPLVHRSQVIDQRERPFCEAALTGRNWRIQKALAPSAGDRHYSNEWKALVEDNFWIAHDDAGSDATLFVSESGIEFDDYAVAAKPHAPTSSQPSPGTHRMGVPAELSTSVSASSSGRLRNQFSRPSSAHRALSGWGFCNERRSSSRWRSLISFGIVRSSTDA